MTGSNAQSEVINAQTSESQDTFGDQLTSELATAEGSSLEIFLQDDEAFEFEDEEALNLLDSTKGMRNMVQAMEQDNDFLADEREEAKEEEYDYFLDAHQDENHNEN